MAAAETCFSPTARDGNCSLPGSLSKGSTSLEELRNQIAAQSGRLVLVSEKEQSNGYSVYYKPAASSDSICQKYYSELLQRCQLNQKRMDRDLCEKKHEEAAARRASLRQAELERLKKQLQLIGKAQDKKQELESRSAQRQQTLEARTLDALQRRLEQQEELKQKIVEQNRLHKEILARFKEEEQRRLAELRTRNETRERQAHALRCEYLQKIRRKCSLAAERSSVSSSVTTEA